MKIEKVAVIGAGVMGAGIAAHVANAGVPVVLLDIVPEGADNRNVIGESALQKLLKSQPAALLHKRNAKLITIGNLEDDLELLSDVDWIIEAVIENLEIKQQLYKRLDKTRKRGSAVSSNTSTIPMALLIKGMAKQFQADFLITHFFNPPRYMRLLEIVAGKATSADMVAKIADFCDRSLGKGVVYCKDTPGFIGNRIGIYWIQSAVKAAFDLGISVEEADAVLSRPVGIPKTGVFGLSDLVGIDLMPHLMKSMGSTLPKSDSFHHVASIPPLIEKMIADGYTGRKGKGGFYRLNREGGQKIKEAVDLNSGKYAPAEKPQLASLDAAKTGLRELLIHEDRGGRYAWQVLSNTLKYAASLVPEISDTIFGVDTAMRLGYGWKWGPFEIIDQLGCEWFAEQLAADGQSVPALLQQAAEVGGFYCIEDGVPQYLDAQGSYQPLPRPPGVVLLTDIKLRGEPLASNGSASLWDIGDGVACLEFHTKMNTMDPDIMAMINRAVEIIPQLGLRGLVIHNEGSNFSAGANLGLLASSTSIGLWDEIERMVAQGQQSYQALKYAPFPVVGAPSGMALGGGCEVLLHCDAVQAHAETYMGLVEVGVGLIPGWGGCKEMLTRATIDERRQGGPMPPVMHAFETISMATVSKSAEEAKSIGYLRPDDSITMNRDRLLADAKAKALELATGYKPPEPVELNLPGPTAAAAFDMAIQGFRKRGLATPHDEIVAGALGSVLSGGATDVTDPITEEEVLALERGAFMQLLRSNATQDRIVHMLETGKPLRN